MNNKSAKFGIGAIVRHRVYPFRGVVVDVDPEFDNTDEWYEAIPAEVRPAKDQPFYHLLAENSAGGKSGRDPARCARRVPACHGTGRYFTG
ncbi:MAG: heat shock protein HspQ [Alphaproteobacteria bacterium]|nr:heat shock protein HspQ [Alphaproteobacteria bacterium]